MANIKECDKLKVHVTQVSENGSEGETSLFFKTTSKFVQLDDDLKEVVKDSFSMSLQGILTRMSSDVESIQDNLDEISIVTINTPHKYCGVGSAIYASCGKEFDVEITRKLMKKDTDFNGYIIPNDRYVVTAANIVKGKPTTKADKYIDKIKPMSIAITI